MKKWKDIPEEIRKEEVYEYYCILKKHEKELVLKRVFDVCASLVLICILSPIMIGIGLCIKVDSAGPVIFRQVRITRYGKKFQIYKFRTMICGADKAGTQVTLKEDSRITRVGKKIRKSRLDELPQLFNILKGEMSFVGTRPEVEKYVKAYSNEMLATLLLPAGVTSKASIYFKDEDALLSGAEDVDLIYVKEILPQKMKYNLEAIKSFSLKEDIKTIFATMASVFM